MVIACTPALCNDVHAISSSHASLISAIVAALRSVAHPSFEHVCCKDFCARSALSLQAVCASFIASTASIDPAKAKLAALCILMQELTCSWNVFNTSSELAASASSLQAGLGKAVVLTSAGGGSNVADPVLASLPPHSSTGLSAWAFGAAPSSPASSSVASLALIMASLSTTFNATDSTTPTAMSLAAFRSVASAAAIRATACSLATPRPAKAFSARARASVASSCRVSATAAASSALCFASGVLSSSRTMPNQAKNNRTLSTSRCIMYSSG
mmetsp:Transcript_57287/g.167662  ORF Transcript_57287/g.167662 Transcript_57287/m.167662 type:complete len:272 (-) Transcript_57287:1429-2244(-)